ncbi:MAG: SpoIIE family protein phosphatase [Deferribacterota bacterium]|nr:SpoIIE family protein phosphatase [Deferribacterota bacterium]
MAIQEIDKTFEIRNNSDLIRVSIYLNKILINCPTNLKDLIEIASSELTTNILKHAEKGELKIYIDEKKIMLKSYNMGRLSVFDLMDGKTNKNSLGIGLGVAGRSADEFYYKFNPVEITWIKYFKANVINRFDIATKVESLVFSGCGDRIIKIEMPSYIFIALLDVSGHGKYAGEQAVKISKFIDNHYYLKLNDIVECLIEYTKNMDRRFVIEFLKLWKIKNKLEFCGIGDVSCKIFYKNKQFSAHPLFNYNNEKLITKNGVLGGVKQDWMKDFNIIEKDIPKGAFILMFSDGISSSITLENTHFNKSPHEIIDQLFNKYKKEDDSSLVIIKCK